MLLHPKLDFFGAFFWVGKRGAAAAATHFGSVTHVAENDEVVLVWNGDDSGEEETSAVLDSRMTRVRVSGHWDTGSLGRGGDAENESC